MPLSVRLLFHALDAQIVGAELAKPLGEAESGRLRRTFLKDGILLLRDQKITRERRRSGALDTHELMTRDPAPPSSRPSAGVVGRSCARQE